MELAFASKALRQLCERKAKALAALGADAAESLHKRLADLEAAETMGELHWLPTTTRSDGSLAVAFHAGYHLIVSANNGEKPLNADGEIDWTSVDRIKLVGLQKP